MNSGKNQIFWIALITMVIICCGEDVAEAAGEASNNRLDGLLEKFREVAASWESVMKRQALSIFWTLATLEFAWSGVILLLKRADLTEVSAEILKRTIYTGFFFTLLTNASDWSDKIIRSFRMIADEANTHIGGTGGISPSKIFDIGVDIGARIAETSSIFSPGESLGMVICGLLVLVSFILIAAFLVVAIVEMWIVTSAGIILLGFGSFQFTRDYAVKYLTFLVSIGLKLMILQLLIGIGENIIGEWIKEFENTSTDVFVLIGASLTLLILTKTVPELLQNLINGANFNTNSGLVTAGAAAAGAAAGVVAGAGGGAMAVREAQKLAGAQGASGMSGILKGMASNLSGHAAKDVSAQMSGVPGSKSGNMGGRMAARMREERLAMGDSSSAENSISPGKGQPNIIFANLIGQGADFASRLGAGTAEKGLLGGRGDGPGLPPGPVQGEGFSMSNPDTYISPLNDYGKGGDDERR